MRWNFIVIIFMIIIGNKKNNDRGKKDRKRSSTWIFFHHHKELNTWPRRIEREKKKTRIIISRILNSGSFQSWASLFVIIIIIIIVSVWAWISLKCFLLYIWLSFLFSFFVRFFFFMRIKQIYIELKKNWLITSVSLWNCLVCVCVFGIILWIVCTEIIPEICIFLMVTESDINFYFRWGDLITISCEMMMK